MLSLPVAELEPVLLAGTTVKRASLHNANEIERLGLRVSDTVFVEKGGEIIPKITGVDMSKRIAGSVAIQYIQNCPECNTLLVRNEGEAVPLLSQYQNLPTTSQRKNPALSFRERQWTLILLEKESSPNYMTTNWLTL